MLLLCKNLHEVRSRLGGSWDLYVSVYAKSLGIAGIGPVFSVLVIFSHGSLSHRSKRGSREALGTFLLDHFMAANPFPDRRDRFCVPLRSSLALTLESWWRKLVLPLRGAEADRSPQSSTCAE